MEEVISSILEAERVADEIVKNAADDAKNVLIYAENNADAIREKAVADFKVHRKSVLAQAEKEAETLYEKKIAEGYEQAKILTDSAKGKIDGAAKRVCEIITE